MKDRASRDANYFKRRAEEERTAANEADSKKAKDVHLQLACEYERLASGAPPRTGGEGDWAPPWSSPATIISADPDDE